MKVNWPIEIIGTGASLPKRIITNAYFADRLETTDEWIVTRTGIRERRMAEPSESTLTFALDAARQALKDAKVEPQELDLIIVATITPEHPLPSTACELQGALGCGKTPAYDIVAACSGFVYSLISASQHIVSGTANTVLVVGADLMFRMADMEDRSSAIILGDGAAAAVIRRCNEPGRGIQAVHMGSDGTRSDLIYVPAGGSKEPTSLRTVNERLQYMRMRGREVYKFAVTHMQDMLLSTLNDAGVTMDQLKLFVPHQSNMRIIESACEKLGIPENKVIVNIHKYGNTSAASVPIALHEARTQGRFAKGDYVLMGALGAGLTWGSILLKA